MYASANLWSRFHSEILKFPNQEFFVSLGICTGQRAEWPRALGRRWSGAGVEVLEDATADDGRQLSERPAGAAVDRACGGGEAGSGRRQLGDGGERRRSHDEHDVERVLRDDDEYDRHANTRQKNVAASSRHVPRPILLRFVHLLIKYILQYYTETQSTSYRPGVKGGGETICPPLMAVRLAAVYVRPRTGP